MNEVEKTFNILGDKFTFISFIADYPDHDDIDEDPTPPYYETTFTLSAVSYKILVGTYETEGVDYERGDGKELTENEESRVENALFECAEYVRERDIFYQTVEDDYNEHGVRHDSVLDVYNQSMKKGA